jgi:hypothetical protein
MREQIVSKRQFAVLAGVTPSCVSQWIARQKLSGDALVGRGCRARIRVDIAREQLRQTVDVDQRLGKTPWEAMPEPPGETGDTIEDRIKAQRLEQLALANAAAREEAAARSGRYVLAADARRDMGRVASRLMTIFESSLTEMANAIIAAPPATPREAARLLREAWRQIRERQAKAIGAEAEPLPTLVEDEAIACEL